MDDREIGVHVRDDLGDGKSGRDRLCNILHEGLDGRVGHFKGLGLNGDRAFHWLRHGLRLT